MPYKVRCTACGKSMRLPVHDAGMAVVCLACGTKFLAPSAEIPLAGEAPTGAATPQAPDPTTAVPAIPLAVPIQHPAAATAPPGRPARDGPEPLRFPPMLGLALVGLVVLLGVAAYTAYRWTTGGPDTADLQALVDEGRDLTQRGQLKEAHAKFREADKLADQLGTEHPEVRALADEARSEQERVFAVLLTQVQPAPAAPTPQPPTAALPTTATLPTTAPGPQQSIDAVPTPVASGSRTGSPTARGATTTTTVAAAAATGPTTTTTTTTAPAVVYKRRPLQPVPEPVTGVTDEEIGRSIQRGVDHLITLFGERGVLDASVAGGDPGGQAGAYACGLNALCVYALLQSGQSIPDERLNVRGPFMRSLIDGMKRLPANEGVVTYARGIRATALALYSRKEDQSALRADVQYLLMTHNKGAYTYAGTRATGSNAVGPRPFDMLWDNSNSQYGLLGVWSGAEVGVEVPGSYWADVQRHWNLNQNADGTWNYREPTAAGRGKVSMTAAGTASLFVVEDYLYSARFGARVGREPFSPQLQKSLDWWEADEERSILEYWGYTLYGIERVGLASGFKYFGKVDWYRQLAAEVVERQRADGSWNAGSPHDAIDTAYALLFLARGRHPILMNKLRFDKGGKEGDQAGYWANRPRDAANLARYAGKKLERPLNWQVASLKVPWHDWLDSPILSIASHRTPYFTDDDLAKFRQYVNAGGMIYLQRDGEDEDGDFDAFATGFVERLFPRHPMTDVPPGHVLFNLLYKIDAPPALKMVDNGARILVLYSPGDLSKSWQLRDERGQRTEFETGVNLFVYAAGKRELRNRLSSPYVSPLSEPAPLGETSVARVSYAGQWDPEPGAWGRFANWFGRTTGTGLTLKTVALEELKPSDAPIAHLTGVAAFTPTAAEVKAIREYVDGGGVLLIDEAGGTGGFAKSMRDALADAFPADALTRVRAGHPLLSPGPPGMDDLGKPRLRPYAIERGGGVTRELESFTAGKGAVFLSDLDITSGLLGTETWGISGYEPAYAQSLVRNLVFWVMDGKADAAKN